MRKCSFLIPVLKYTGESIVQCEWQKLARYVAAPKLSRRGFPGWRTGSSRASAAEGRLRTPFKSFPDILTGADTSDTKWLSRRHRIIQQNPPTLGQWTTSTSTHGSAEFVFVAKCSWWTHQTVANCHSKSYPNITSFLLQDKSCSNFKKTTLNEHMWSDLLVTPYNLQQKFFWFIRCVTFCNS